MRLPKTARIVKFIEFDANDTLRTPKQATFERYVSDMVDDDRLLISEQDSMNIRHFTNNPSRSQKSFGAPRPGSFSIGSETSRLSNQDLSITVIAHGSWRVS